MAIPFLAWMDWFLVVGEELGDYRKRNATLSPRQKRATNAALQVCTDFRHTFERDG
jgi:hypothetical protein